MSIYSKLLLKFTEFQISEPEYIMIIDIIRTISRRIDSIIYIPEHGYWCC